MNMETNNSHAGVGAILPIVTPNDAKIGGAATTIREAKELKGVTLSISNTCDYNS